MMVILACVLAGVWGVVWAAVLQFTRLGAFLAVKRTWLTVVIGVGMDLLILLLVVDWLEWLLVCAVVGCSSLGMVGRSLYNEAMETDEILNGFKDAAG